MRTKVFEVDPDFPELDKISQCAKLIRQGGLVVFPTETVYGIAADFNNEQAMERLRKIKKRSTDKPFAVLISQKGLIANYTHSSNPSLYKLIDKFWPGPLTIVVPGHSAGETIGVRMPDHTVALSLVQESQCTVAAPSANPEGAMPPSTCGEALKYFDGLVDAAIDGGTAAGQSSSVVDFTKEHPVILRPGAISQEDIDRTVKKKTVLFVCTGNSCRSVMAEYMLRKMLKDRLDVEVSSAGTGVYVRASASAETMSILRKEGVDAISHVSRPIDRILLNKSDLILVMTRAHRQQVLERVPDVEKRIYQLREFSTEPIVADMNLDIPDPIGKPAEAYEECMLMIKDSLEKVANLI